MKSRAIPRARTGTGSKIRRKIPCKTEKLCLLFRAGLGIIADGSALHDEGVIIHEERYSSVLRRSGCPLCVRRDLPDGLHQGRAQGRNLQQVPSVLYRPSEAGRQRRKSRSLQKALRTIRAVSLNVAIEQSTRITTDPGFSYYSLILFYCLCDLQYMYCPIVFASSDGIH